MVTEGKFSASDREDCGFLGESDSREEAVLAWFSSEQEDLPRDKWLKLGCWVGEIRKPICPSSFIHASNIIEHIQCQDEYSVDWAESWPGSSGEQEEELENELRQVFLAWMERHKLHPKFFMVDAVEYMTVEQALANCEPRTDPASEVAGIVHPSPPSSLPA